MDASNSTQPTQDAVGKTKVQYGSFQDPVGLVFRMLRSRNRAAYSGLMREGLKVATAPIDFAMSMIPRRNSTSAVTPDQPIVLIVGPPRSGTTLTYQILARYCDVTYPDNVNSLFPR